MEHPRVDRATRLPDRELLGVTLLELRFEIIDLVTQSRQPPLDLSACPRAHYFDAAFFAVFFAVPAALRGVFFVAPTAFVAFALPGIG